MTCNVRTADDTNLIQPNLVNKAEITNCSKRYLEGSQQSAAVLQMQEVVSSVEPPQQLTFHM